MRTLFCLIVLVVCACRSAHADMLLQLGTGGTVSGIATSFNGAPGTSLVLDVWLTQRGLYTIASTPVGEYRLSNDGTSATGLASYTYDVTSSNTDVGINLSNITYGTGFDPLTGNTTRPNNLETYAARVSGFTPEAALNSGIAVPVFVTQPYVSPFASVGIPNNGSDAANSIRLGTVTFDIGAAVASSFTIVASSPFFEGSSNYMGIGSNIITPAAAIGAQSFTATINISAVPEPTTWLFGTVLVGLGASRIRRRARA